MLVKACLCAVKVCKRSFNHCRSLLKNVLACLRAGNDTMQTSFDPPGTSSNPLEGLLKFHEGF